MAGSWRSVGPNLTVIGKNLQRGGTRSLARKGLTVRRNERIRKRKKLRLTTTHSVQLMTTASRIIDLSILVDRDEPSCPCPLTKPWPFAVVTRSFRHVHLYVLKRGWLSGADKKGEFPDLSHLSRAALLLVVVELLYLYR